jgi:hypothetical protein
MTARAGLPGSLSFVIRGVQLVEGDASKIVAALFRGQRKFSAAIVRAFALSFTTSTAAGPYQFFSGSLPANPSAANLKSLSM